MSNVARRLAILTCVVLVLVAIGVSGFWFYGAERLKSGFAAWESNWRARGGELGYESLQLGGFPLRFRAHFERPVMGQAETRTPWHWQGERLRLNMSPFAPRARAFFPGEHKITFTWQGIPVALTAAAKKAEGRYRRRSGETVVALEGSQIRLQVNGQEATTIDRLSIETVGLRSTDHLEPSARFAVAVDELMLPQGRLPEAFRARVDLGRLKGQVLGPVGPEVTRAQVTAWRDLGGTVEIERLELRWGPLTVVAVGTLALDEDLQPLAALTATITGYAETVDALRTAGALQPKEAEAAKSLLKLLAKPPRLLGGPPEIAVPLTIQNQRLSLGPVALLTLPRLDWPD